MDIVTLEICETSSERLDKVLAALTPEAAALSRSRLARLMAEGQVIGPDGTAVGARAKAEAGIYTITLPPPEDIEARPEAIALDVLYEDDALIVINKPAGMVVHPAPGTPQGTLVNALLAHCAGSLSGIGGARRPGIVHRIDKDTSGVLVVAKSDRAHHGLAAQFEAHTAQRRYIAVAFGQIDPGDARLRGTRGVSFEPGGILKITSHLGRHPTDRQRQAVSFTQGRHAVTRARMCESFGTPPVAMRVECWLETGRTHQIRVHMAHAGLGLIGDPVYGGARRASVRALGPEIAARIDAFPRQALHAATLGFRHPTRDEWMEFEAPLPDDMQSLLAALRGGTDESREL